MLPDYRAWEVLEKITEPGFRSPYKTDLLGLLTTMRARIARYNKYEDELERIELEKEKMSKKDYDLQKTKQLFGMKEVKKLIDKSNRDICFYARKAHILDDDAGDIIEEGVETQRKQRIKGRGRFRMRTSATDVGVDMGTDRIIRSVNRISDSMNKKFK